MAEFDIAAVRKQFPALDGKQIYLDNAGGSQTLGSVIESIQKYLSGTNVQLGATYNVSKDSTNRYNEGYKAAAKYVNADFDEVVLGGSTTQLFRILSFTLNFQPEDEIIVSSIDHEANIAPWVGLAKRQNLKLKWWTPAPSSNPVLQASDLDALLSPRTRLVTCTHASNLLGTIHDVRSIADKVHTIPGAKLCVDGVAYAPHRQIDVKAFGVDFYSFSWYKVYGPHMALLYAKKDAHELIDPLTHFFNPQATLADKLSLAASNYEITASLPTLTSYFGSDLKKTFEGFAEQESKLQGILLDYLNAHEGVMLFGSPSKDSSVRVPTISFTVKGKGQLEIMDTVEKNTPFGFRAGHMYSKRLCDDVLKVNQEGVVRVSFVHYNTEEEARGLVEVLKKIIGEK